MTKIDAVVRDQCLVIDLLTNDVVAPTLELAFAYKGKDAPEPVSLALGEVVAEDYAMGLRHYSARVALPSLDTKLDHRLRSIGFRLLDGDAPVANDRIASAGWQVTRLHVADRKIFNQVMRYSFQRIDDAETLMYVARNTAQDEAVELRIRITCFVVFCYRAIELGRYDLLEASLDLFDAYEARFGEMERFTQGSVREVGEQVVLSLLSVKWHVLICLRRFGATLDTLRQILGRGRDNPQYHKLPFATNYANVAALLTFVHFLADKPLSTPNPVTDMYSQFRGIMTGLPEGIPPSEYIHEFKPVLEKMAILADLNWILSEDCRVMLAQEEPDTKALRREKFARGKYTPKFMLTRCTRVTKVPDFDAAFFEFCENALTPNARRPSHT